MDAPSTPLAPASPPAACAAPLVGGSPWVDWLVLLVAGVAIVLLRLHAWRLPLDADEANYMLFAKFWASGAGRLYEDLWDNKPLGTFILFRAGTALFGYHEATPRVMSVLAMLASTVCLWGLLRRWGRVVAGLALCLAWFPLTCHVPSQATGANIEVFLLPLVLGAWWCLAAYLATGRAGAWWAAMALLVLSLLLKPVTLPFLAAAFVVEWPRGTAGWWRLARRAALTALLVVGAHLALYAACGYRPQQLLTQWQENARYTTASGEPLMVRLTVGVVKLPWAEPLAGLKTLAIVAAAALLLAAAWRRRATDWLLLLGAAAGAAAVVIPGGHQAHYYVLLLPFVVVGLTAGLGWVLTQTAWVQWAGLLLLAFLTLVPLYRDYLQHTPNEISMRQADGSAWFLRDRAVGEYLAMLKISHHRIFVDGSHPGVFFYSDNLPATRFHVAWTVTTGVTSYADTLAALQARPPRVIVQLEGASPLPALDAWIAEAYEQVLFGSVLREWRVEVLRRRQAPNEEWIDGHAP